MSAQANTIVETGSGKIEGIFEKSLYVFKGVPYTAPPVGQLRWLPPQPHQPWTGIRPVKSYGPIPPQIVMPPQPGLKLPGLVTNEPQSEDCLTLNIWTPSLDNKKRPVMVWIPGGAFIMGAGSLAIHEGDVLASRGDVVVVTINYRLGLLGLLNLNEVTKGQIPTTGNEGLLDQIAALEWVRDNIARFGGDPGNVTVFGESAGGMSIGCLLAMPKAQGLFHKAILESGVAGSAARPLAPSVKVARDLLAVLKLTPGDIDKLQTMPVEKLLAAQQALIMKSGDGVTPVMPVIDGKVLPAPLDTIRAGSAPGVPVIIGTNRDEWRFFDLMTPDFGKLTEDDLIKAVEARTAVKNVAEVIDTYRDARARMGEPTTPSDISAAVNTDAMFRIPALRVLEARIKNKQAAYSYMFTWKSPVLGGVLRACHALEIGFVFGHVDKAFCGSGPLADQLASQIQDAWIAFARTGNPSTESLGDWPQYGKDRKTMMLGKESRVEDAPFDEEREIWDRIGDPIAQIEK